ncbi:MULTISPECIES: alpha/beta fold hydrolase [Rhizobium]|jgi:pimeloyl-ACP methyl ester carboxylesterase|uniref:alpha/beta fold hydrolase n=1 Tax=Rhizobium TaxID=379 RepID=UPI001C9262D0|nr:alpha/beta hydrolase [Rhizobium leguminosarum]MBY2944253.1 alpha/beta hydrolase [Rhizobium leguminosarum]
MQRCNVMKLASLALALSFCLANAQTNEAARYPNVNYTDASPHKSGFAHVNGIDLNYLDWGGDGPAVVMIHGIGDDPHIFDDLASLLHDRFRIIAYARRGHGLSEGPPGPYDAATLTEDFRQLVDHLGIQRMSVIGWSMGGDEGTAFAGQYPDRVDKLIYLDGGYDWSTPAFLKAFEDILAANSPGEADVRSLDAVRAWYHEAWPGKAIAWTPGLEAYIRDLAQPDANGTLHLKPDDPASAAVFATLGNWKRDYTKVQAPTLALYATTFFPVDRADPGLVQKLRDFNENIMKPFRQASMERVRREIRNVTVKQIADSNHMTIGLKQPDAVAAMIREFLLASSPR